MQGHQDVMSRRRALALGGGLAGGLVLGRTPLARAAGDAPLVPDAAAQRRLPTKEIEEILQADGSWVGNTFNVEVERDDVHVTNTTFGIPFTPNFQIASDFFFQPLGRNQAITNSDISLLTDEVNPVIDQLLASGFAFQAEHQHFIDIEPKLWFVHFRGVGDPLELARGMALMLARTATPLPQSSPKHPTTPLPKKEIDEIIGVSGEVGPYGTISYDIPRKEKIVLGGVRISPFLNVATSIVFEPLNDAGTQAAASPDFGMLASEINPVTTVMRQQGWDVGCLFIQETDEQPQLYFSHMVKPGDPIQLAQEIRRGLDLMNLDFSG